MKHKLSIIIFAFFTFLQQAFAIWNILDFGAVPFTDTVAAQFANQKAILKAVQKANSTTNGERAIRIPKGTFYSMPIRMEYLFNVTFVIEGKLTASLSIVKWPKQPNSKYFEDFISCYDCSYIQFGGSGKIDGRGYHWWIVCIMNDKKYLENQNYRPHLMHLVRNTNIYIHDIVMKNSPQFHLKMDHCYDAQIHSVQILVNTTAQLNLFKRLSLVGIIPLFPLNTDGIDPAGARMHIYNLTVQNYDDVVVPKPSHQDNWGGNCTQDMLIQNSTVFLGVGMTIGSVPPNKGCNCIRNITFRNVNMIRPLKGIYVKTNPGDVGTGLVENIYYKNFTMDRPVWWAIYIGPQQMKEPDGDGPGCMLYPFDKHGTCTTQPRVTLRNITLDDISIHESLLYPVTIRCNVTNPCKDINFINVKTDGWRIGQKKNGYVCQYATGLGINNKPNIGCLRDDRQQNLQVEAEAENEMGNGNIWDNMNMETFKLLIEEMEKATLEVGYHQEDDEFDYDFDPQLHFSEEQQEQIE